MATPPTATPLIIDVFMDESSSRPGWLVRFWVSACSPKWIRGRAPIQWARSGFDRFASELGLVSPQGEGRRRPPSRGAQALVPWSRPLRRRGLYACKWLQSLPGDCVLVTTAPARAGFAEQLSGGLGSVHGTAALHREQASRCYCAGSSFQARCNVGERPLQTGRCRSGWAALIAAVADSRH
jgi:hypothetical protein